MVSVVTQTSGDGGDGEPHPVTGHPAHDGLASASHLFTTNPGSHFHKQKSLTPGSIEHSFCIALALCLI